MEDKKESRKLAKYAKEERNKGFKMGFSIKSITNRAGAVTPANKK